MVVLYVILQYIVIHCTKMWYYDVYSLEPRRDAVSGGDEIIPEIT